MKVGMQLVPTTLHQNPEFVQSEIDRFAQFEPKPERFQLDIIDGEFADNLTVEPGIVHQLEMHGMTLDLHLMVVEPLEWLREIRDCATIGTVIAQVERMTSIPAFVDEVTNELEYEVGLALDVYTPFAAIPEDVLPDLTVVQIMANEAGFQGKEFKQIALQTIQEAAKTKERMGYKFDICVDIGMNDTTIPQVQAAGATMVAIGSFLGGSEGAENWKKLQTSTGA